MGQWWIRTFFCDKHRRTVSDYPDSKLLGWNKKAENPKKQILPLVISPSNNPPLSNFIRHVADGDNRDQIPHPTRHNALQWIGMPVVSEEDVDCDDCFA